MIREKFYSHKEEKLDPDFLSIEDVEQKLFTSKHHIQQIKISLRNYSDEKIKFKQQLDEINHDALAVQEKLHPGCSTIAMNSNKDEKLIQLEQSLAEIRTFVGKFRGNEEKLKRDIKNKDDMIKDFKTMQRQVQQQMDQYKQTIHMYQEKTNYLTRSLKNSKRVIKDDRLEAERKRQNLTNLFEENQLELINALEQKELALINHQSNIDSLNQRLEEKSRMIDVFQQKEMELNEMMEEKDKFIAVLEQQKREFRQCDHNWAGPQVKEYKQEDNRLHTMKRGRWSRMVWSLWNRDSEIEYLEKIEQLNNMVKDLQQALGHNESILEKMNNYFQRYEENEIKYSKQIKELNDKLQSFQDKEGGYISKLSKMENELSEYKKQNIAYKEQVEAMGETIKKLQDKEAGYKSKLDQMKSQNAQKVQQLNKTIQSFQEKEKQYSEQFQRTFSYPGGISAGGRQTTNQATAKSGRQTTNQATAKSGRQTTNQATAKSGRPTTNQAMAKSGRPTTNQAMAKSGRQTINQAKTSTNKQQLTASEMMKRYYPQAQSQSQISIFNPFKYS